VFDLRKYSVHDGPGIRTTVFLKGCPLSCLWCHNPESQSFWPELLHRSSACIGCGACIAPCPEKALTPSPDGGVILDRTRCLLCGACVAPVCDALEMAGSPSPCEDATVRQDVLFFDQSGGGLPSPREPVSQPAFLAALLRRAAARDCHRRGYLGYAPSETLLAVRAGGPLSYDLKHMDSGATRGCGVPNDLIPENARLLSDVMSPHWIRIPLVPGINDDERNLHDTGAFVGDAADVRRFHSSLPSERTDNTKLADLRAFQPCNAVFER
jgi:pyruvate formate lyase activating enzyme